MIVSSLDGGFGGPSSPRGVGLLEDTGVVPDEHNLKKIRDAKGFFRFCIFLETTSGTGPLLFVAIFAGSMWKLALFWSFGVQSKELLTLISLVCFGSGSGLRIVNLLCDPDIGM